jgi:hypothetical protein
LFLERIMLRKTFALSLVVVLACSLFFAINIKPASASTNQIYWGAWVGSSHIGNYNLLQTFESTVGKDVSIWDWIQLWNRPDDSENRAEFDTALMNQARNNGIIPMVSWAPEAGDPNDQFVNLQSILDGTQDAYLTAFGQAAAAWGHPFFVRLMWEFTGEWTAEYCPFIDGNTPTIFVQAWQYIVDKVRAAGGTQISWVWCPADLGDSVSKLQSLYPGDQYVDWVGTDVYPGAGQSFSSAAQTELNNIRSVAPNKPVMLPELGYTYSDGNSWWSNFLGNVLPNNYPYIKAVVIWEMPPGNTVVDANDLSGFQHRIASSYYSSNVYSSLNISPINAIGENPNPTPTPIPTPQPTPQPTGYPTTKSTHSPATASSGFSVFDVAIIVVIAVITFMAVYRSRSRLFRIIGRFVHYKINLSFVNFRFLCAAQKYWQV